MSKFIVGNIYKDQNGQEYKFLSERKWNSSISIQQSSKEI